MHPCYVKCTLWLLCLCFITIVLLVVDTLFVLLRCQHVLDSNVEFWYLAIDMLVAIAESNVLFAYFLLIGWSRLKWHMHDLQHAACGLVSEKRCSSRLVCVIKFQSFKRRLSQRKWGLATITYSGLLIAFLIQGVWYSCRRTITSLKDIAYANK